MKKQLKLKLSMASFLQDALKQMSERMDEEANEFLEFMDRVDPCSQPQNKIIEPSFFLTQGATWAARIYRRPPQICEHLFRELYPSGCLTAEASSYFYV